MTKTLQALATQIVHAWPTRSTDALALLEAQAAYNGANPLSVYRFERALDVNQDAEDAHNRMARATWYLDADIIYISEGV